MATRRFTVEKALDAVFDNDFSLSDDESSEEEEEVDDLYALLGEPVIRTSDIDALASDCGVGDGDSDDIVIVISMAIATMLEIELAR